ncbi:MAG: glycosyltransferase family 4 protein [Mycobacteriales bacterium]
MTSPGARPGLLLLTSNYPRWSGDSTTPFVHHLAQDLSARGWRVQVLAPHAAGAAHGETLDGVAVRRFRYALPDRRQTLCYGGGALVNLAASRSAALLVPALVAAEWQAAARLLRTGSFAALHSHWVLPQGWVGTRVARHRLPHLLTVHGGDVFGLTSGALARFKRAALLAADAVSVNSSATQAAVRRLAPAVQRLHRIPMGVAVGPEPDPLDVQALRSRYRRGNGPLLVFVGRVVADKGVADLVAAVALLAAGPLPDVTAVLVGEGQHRSSLGTQVRAASLADRVHLPGWAQPGEVPSWLAAADVVVAPSRIGEGGWTEAQGLSVAEALAAGRPLVATRVGGIPDTVTDGVHGLLVAERDPAALAEAVGRLVADPALATRLATAGQLRVRAELSREASADAFDAVLRDLVARGPATPARASAR